MNHVLGGPLLGGGGVPAERLAKASGRQHLRTSDRADELLNAWHAMEPVDPDRAAAASGPASSEGEALQKALTHLVSGAAYQSGVSPREALESLRQAEAQFRSLSMHALCQATRVEAAWHVRQAGFPALALRSLESPDALAYQQFAHGVHAVRSLCLLDLGRLEDAARSVREASRALACEAAWGSQRGRWYIRAAALQLRATRGLLKRHVACHLTEAAPGQPETASVPGPGEPDGADQDSTWVALPPPGILQEQDALEVLVEAAWSGNEPVFGSGLMRLVADFALRPRVVGAQAWLWLGNALMARGNPRLAITFLEDAVSTARSCGQSRIHRGALIDLVHACEQSGLMKEALTAHKALRSLEAEMHAGSPSQPRSVAWTLRDPSSGGSPHLVRALRVLASAEDHFTVDSLAAACTVSRRTLEKVFRSELGQSVAECLRARRLELVRVRLSESTDSIKKIALESGYPSSSALCHDFKRTNGLTPARFRALKATVGGPAN